MDDGSHQPFMGDPDDWLARLRAGTPEAELVAIDLSREVSPLRGRFEALMG